MNDDRVNDIKRIIGLKKLLTELETKDPLVLENEYFSQYNCDTEDDKVYLEATYVKHYLTKNVDRLSAKNSYKVNLNMINTIINILNKHDVLTKDAYKTIKQSIIKIELESDMRVRFYTEVNDLYKVENDKLELKRKK